MLHAAWVEPSPIGHTSWGPHLLGGALVVLGAAASGCGEPAPCCRPGKTPNRNLNRNLNPNHAAGPGRDHTVTLIVTLTHAAGPGSHLTLTLTLTSFPPSSEAQLLLLSLCFFSPLSF